MWREIEDLEMLESLERIDDDQARRLAEYRRLLNRILVLPGFEFTATFGFHILALFPPETSIRKLEHILLTLEVPEDKLASGSSEVGATTDVLRSYELHANSFIRRPLDFQPFVEAARELERYALLSNEPPPEPPDGGSTAPLSPGP
jgi:hypothetical protein